jgi:hypothetical protein
MQSIKGTITSPLLKRVESNDIKIPELAVKVKDGMKSYEEETGKSVQETPYISSFIFDRDIEI